MHVHIRMLMRLAIIIVLMMVIVTLPIPHAMKIAKYEGQTSNATLPLNPVSEQAGYNASVGINDNGSALINGNIINYGYSTNNLYGGFAFYGGSFYSESPADSTAFGVQLNSNFNVTNSMTLWAQDVFHVQYQNGVYYVVVEDNIWNSTGALINQSLVYGNGTVYSYNKQSYYAYEAPTVYETRAPFILYANMTISQTNTSYPVIYMYYEFENTTYDSGLILYDVITIRIPSNNPQFLTGIHSNINSYNPSAPFVTQWVVCGEYGGAQLNVYSWNATMFLGYEYNGSLFSVPDAVSLQPLYLTAGATGENVNQYYGIQEYYINQIGIIKQIQGETQQEFLWQPNINYTLNGNNLTLFLTPPLGEWLVTITGNNYYNELYTTSPVSYNLQPGTYQIDATLYAGSTPVYTFSKSITVYGEEGGIVNVTSPVEFYVDGFQHLAGTYQFDTPVNLTFPSVYNINDNSRLVFEYLLVNGQKQMSNTIYLTTSANVTAVYQQQYYVTLPFPLNAFVNGVYQEINSNWYNASDKIVIPTQTVYNGETRYIIYNMVSYTITSPITINPPYYTQYYVKINQEIPAEINGVNTTLTSNWYNQSTTINIFNIYNFNSTTRVLINSNVSKITLSEPIVIQASTIYQYYVGINLPNGTIKGWYNASEEISLPNVIYNGSDERYILNQNSEIIVNKALNITPSYIKQFYVIVNLPNETINGWYNSSSLITLPSIIYNGSLERYVLNQSSQIFVNKAFSITPLYIRQFYVIVNLPNETIKGWYNESSAINLPSIIYNGSLERYVINQSKQIVVNKPINIIPLYVKQFYVVVNLPNGTISNWYNLGSTITLPSMIYNGSNERFIINQGNKLLVNGPINLKPVYIKQFYVIINLPNETIKNWYNSGVSITLPSVIYNGSLEKYVINQTHIITVQKAFNLTPIYVKQFYIKIILPNETISNWYNSSSTIILPEVIYNGSLERYVINQSNTISVKNASILKPTYIKQFYVIVKLPNGTIKNWYNENYSIILPKIIYNGSNVRYVINQSKEIFIASPISATANYTKQFYVIVKLPNGTLSNWFNNNAVINLPKAIYVGNNERYVLNQNSSVVVLSPINEAPSYTEQFLVTINGVSNWYNAGSTIRLYEPISAFETLTWVGNYTLPNNSNITVNGPIVENVKISTNTATVGGITGVIVVVAILGAVVALRKH